MLAAYLTTAFVLLAVVFTLRPHQGPAPAAPTWDYQRERVELEGGGALNAYARWAVGTTAFLTRGSIERQRDVHRLSPLDFLAGQAAARDLAAWRERHRLPLEGATLAAVCALAAWGTLRRRPGRLWLVALLALIGLTLLVTRPQSATALAARAGTALPNLVQRAAAATDPSTSVATTAAPGHPGSEAVQGKAGGAGSEAVQRTVAGRYWTAFVGQPLSRLQTGTTVLATAPPEAKPGVLGSLRARVTAVGDWAIGRRGPERAVIATLALAYVLPFALALVALAMLASCAQALVWLLALAGPWSPRWPSTPAAAAPCCAGGWSPSPPPWPSPPPPWPPWPSSGPPSSPTPPTPTSACSWPAPPPPPGRRPGHPPPPHPPPPSRPAPRPPQRPFPRHPTRPNPAIARGGAA